MAGDRTVFPIYGVGGGLASVVYFLLGDRGPAMEQVAALGRLPSATWPFRRGISLWVVAVVFGRAASYSFRSNLPA